MDQIKKNKPMFIGLTFGVLYGLSIRILWGLEGMKNIGGLVTFSFMVLVPFAVGFIRVHYECKAKGVISFGKMIVIAWQPIFVFILITAILLLEGSICIVMALPLFMLLASLGGLAAGGIYRMTSKRKNGTLISVALLPLLIAPLEVNFIHTSKIYQVENSIEINATPDVVWKQLANVRTIEKSELSFSLTALIGVPRPIEANMNAEGVGAVRTSKWDKGVVFKEVITDWTPSKRMAYTFDIDPEAIPDNVLDQHVKLGGEYFSPIVGEYLITNGRSGNTILHLKTTLRDNTNFGIYSRIWGEVIFQDFHMSLLKLMKHRSETSVNKNVSQHVDWEAMPNKSIQ